MKTLIELEKERLEWSLSVFQDATPESSLRKLIGEAYEAIEETKYLKPNIKALTEEYADCLMCLFDSAGRAGVSVEEIVEAFGKKLEKNTSRVVVRKDNIEKLKEKSEEYIKMSERPHEDNDFSYLCGREYCRCCS